MGKPFNPILGLDNLKEPTARYDNGNGKPLPGVGALPTPPPPPNIPIPTDLVSYKEAGQQAGGLTGQWVADQVRAGKLKQHGTRIDGSKHCKLVSLAAAKALVTPAMIAKAERLRNSRRQSRLVSQEEAARRCNRSGSWVAIMVLKGLLTVHGTRPGLAGSTIKLVDPDEVEALSKTRPIHGAKKKKRESVKRYTKTLAYTAPSLVPIAYILARTDRPAATFRYWVKTGELHGEERADGIWVDEAQALTLDEHRTKHPTKRTLRAAQVAAEKNVVDTLVSRSKAPDGEGPARVRGLDAVRAAVNARVAKIDMVNVSDTPTSQLVRAFAEHVMVARLGARSITIEEKENGSFAVTTVARQPPPPTTFKV